MTINTAKQAEAAALRQTHNVPGTCQLSTRGWYNAPSAGDQDRDGDADAIDGWLSEPVSARHVGDRNPPTGVPLAFRNASHNGFGHRCMTITDGIRSTDMFGNRYRSGVTSTVTGKSRSDQIAVIERSMGLIYIGWSSTIDGNPIKGIRQKSVTTPKGYRDIKIMHASGQFSDTAAQHKADAIALFETAKKKDVGWLTTTEGGPGAGGSNWTKNFVAQAKLHGFETTSQAGTDAMIAVNKDLIDGNYKSYVSPIIVPGKAHDHAAKKVIAASFHNKELGNISVMAGHYLTKGRPDAKSPEYRQHLAENKAFAKAIGEYAAKAGAGKDLVFYGGDQNIVDRINDTFLGQTKFVTAWDELKHYENTGHGNIDVTASWKPDARVKALSCHALNDKRLFMNFDHFVVEAVYRIRVLKAA